MGWKHKLIFPPAMANTTLTTDTVEFNTKGRLQCPVFTSAFNLKLWLLKKYLPTPAVTLQIINIYLIILIKKNENFVQKNSPLS